MASLLSAAVTAMLGGLAIWYLAARYLRLHHPHHGELASAAVVAGCLDGVLLGIGAFVFTFAVRIWLYERAERKRSDQLLRLALEDLHRTEP